MLKSLELLQQGQINPKHYESTITYNRVSGLQLSEHSVMERFHRCGVTALDLEKHNERFMLSGGKNGDIAIHDLQDSSGDPSYVAKVTGRVNLVQSNYGHRNLITTVQWYPFDDGAFMTSGMDHHLKIWDTNQMKAVESFPMEYKINAHHMSPLFSQRHLIAVARKSPHIILVDPKSGERSHELRGHRIEVCSLQWSPVCENLLASGGLDSKIIFWDVRSAKSCLDTLDQYNGESSGKSSTAHDQKVNALKFTPDGLHLVSHGLEGRLRLWDVSLCKNTMVNFGALTTHPSGLPMKMDMYFHNSLSVLFVPCVNQVFTYDLFTGLQIQRLIGHFDYVTACVYRSFTHELYSGAVDRNILIWSPDRYENHVGLSQEADRYGNDWSD